MFCSRVFITPEHRMSELTYLSPDEFARAIGRSVKTVRRRLKAGQLPALQPGGPGTAWLIDYPTFKARVATVGHDQSIKSKGPNTVASSIVASDFAGQLTSRVDATGDESSVAEFISGPRPQWMRPTRIRDTRHGSGP